MEENSEPKNQEEPIPAQEPTPEISAKPKAPDLKGPSGFRRVSYSLFGAETRTGRFFRTLLRGLAVIVGLLALGALAFYLVLFRPVDQQLKDARVKATDTTVDLQRARFDLDKAQTGLKDAQTTAKDATEKLTIEQTRVQILRAKNFLLQAQMGLLAKDKIAASKALTSAENVLKQAQPSLEKIDANQFTTLQALFTLVKNDMERDLNLAIQDLNRLQEEMNRTDSSLP